MAPEFEVPLLSQEGPTRRLLPGAAAPYPALDQISKFPAVSPSFVVPAAAGIVFVFGTQTVV